MLKKNYLMIIIALVFSSNTFLFSQVPLDTLWTSIYKDANRVKKFNETFGFEIDVIVFSSEARKMLDKPVEISGFFIMENLLSPYEENSEYFFISSTDVSSIPIHLDIQDGERSEFERNYNKKIKVRGILRENDYTGKYQTGLWIEEPKIIK